MSCLYSSPHQARRKYAAALRTFGFYRAGSVPGGVIPPDDIDGLPSCQMVDNFAYKEPVSVEV